jgi:hypothetical protein
LGVLDVDISSGLSSLNKILTADFNVLCDLFGNDCGDDDIEE